jgi:hypothetical protein
VQRVTVTVSEPWDFASSSGINVFVAEVHGEGDGTGRLLLRFLEPVRKGEADWHWFVATPEMAGGCALYGLSEQEATSDDWSDALATWRGESPAARGALSAQ